MSWTSGDVATPTYEGIRLQNTPTNAANPEDLDAQARNAGFPDFATMQDQDPIGANQLLTQNGGGGSGTTYNQAADHDNVNANRLIGILAAMAVPYNTGGAAFAGAGAGAGAGAAGGIGAADVAGGGDIAGAVASGAAPELAGGATGGIASALAHAGGSSLIPLIGGVASGIENAYESGQNRDQNQSQFDATLKENQAALAQALGISQAQLAQNESQFEASQKQNQGQFDSTQTRLYGQQALAATQDDPFKQAKSREGQALLASLLSTGYQPGGLKNVMTPQGLAGASQFVTPDAMAGNEAAFTANAQKASGGQYVPPDPNAVGYGGGSSGGGLKALLALLHPPTPTSTPTTGAGQ